MWCRGGGYGRSPGAGGGGFDTGVWRVQVHVTRRPSSSVIVEFLESARSIACRLVWCGVGCRVGYGCSVGVGWARLTWRCVAQNGGGYDHGGSDVGAPGLAASAGRHPGASPGAAVSQHGGGCVLTIAGVEGGWWRVVVWEIG